MIADILISIATGLFIVAEVRQIKRMHKTKSTNGISLTHYHMKLSALICMITAYTILHLSLSVFAAATEITLQLIAIYLICKYRQISFFTL